MAGSARNLETDVLAYTVMSAARCLVAVSPHHANLVYEAANQQSRLERQGIDFTNKWQRLSHGYIFASPEGAGRFVRTLPPGVAPGDVVNVDVDAAATPFSDELRQLLEELERRPADDDDAPAAQHVGRLALHCASPGFNRERLAAWRAFARSEVEDLSPRAGYVANSVRSVLESSVATVRQARALKEADAYLTATFLIIRDLCLAVEHAAEESDRRTVSAPMIGYFDWLVDSSIEDEVALVTELLCRVVVDGFGETAVEVAEAHAAAGDELIEGALAADDWGRFYQSLFEAAPWEASAMLLNAGLVHSASEEQLAVPRPDWRARAAAAAEEKLVRIGWSFCHQLTNIDGGRRARHERMLQDVAAKQGYTAAERRAAELIELHFLYPRWMKRQLLSSLSPGG